MRITDNQEMKSEWVDLLIGTHAMRHAYILSTLCLVACASSDGGAGGYGAPGGSPSATQTITGSTIGGGATNQAGTSTGGAGAPGGAGGAGGTSTADVKTDVRLALDPAAFAQLFG